MPEDAALVDWLRAAVVLQKLSGNFAVRCRSIDERLRLYRLAGMKPPNTVMRVLEPKNAQRILTKIDERYETTPVA